MSVRPDVEKDTLVFFSMGALELYAAARPVLQPVLGVVEDVSRKCEILVYRRHQKPGHSSIDGLIVAHRLVYWTSQYATACIAIFDFYTVVLLPHSRQK